MKLRRHREISVFNLSMLDVIACALGAILVVLIVVLSQKGELEAEVRRSALEVQKAREVVEASLSNSGTNLPMNLVIVLDISASMHLNEDNVTSNHRMEEARAAVKLLLATLGGKRNMDIVVFPAPGGRGDFAALWGQLTPFGEEKRNEALFLLDSLVPEGGAPTRAALEYVLGYEGYRDAAGIVLVSAAIPRKPADLSQPDDVDGLLRSLRPSQTTFQINTVGVGLKESPVAEDFMKRLAVQFGGFYLPL